VVAAQAEVQQEHPAVQAVVAEPEEAQGELVLLAKAMLEELQMEMAVAVVEELVVLDRCLWEIMAAMADLDFHHQSLARLLTMLEEGVGQRIRLLQDQVEQEDLAVVVLARMPDAV
jgi:hypothetical protein